MIYLYDFIPVFRGNAIREFHGLLGWVNERGFTLRATPVRRYHRTDTGELVSINTPEEEAKW
ncbi:MAG TPA: hypothetical protein VMX56_08500 [Anaerolineales bacterium]|nr:hypothetical protein [Anaerolineales bacterium]